VATVKKQRFSFSGKTKEDSLVVGSHGDAIITVDGEFELSGIIYCPKYTVTLSIKGEGKIAFRGKCSKIVIRKMDGNCTLDLTDLTCKELRCESVGGQSTVIAGKTRVITQANLSDDAVLHVSERPLITNSSMTGTSRIVYRNAVIRTVLN
jgi:hypothetical protein